MSLFEKYGISPESVREHGLIANAEAARAAYEHLAREGCLGAAPAAWEDLDDHQHRTWVHACGTVSTNAFFDTVKALREERKASGAKEAPPMMTPKRLGRELQARLDGPHDDEHTAAAADLAAECVRFLNYATGSHSPAGLVYPSTVYLVAADLSSATHPGAHRGVTPQAPARAATDASHAARTGQPPQPD